MRKLLLQLDSSRLPSVFDQVVGVRRRRRRHHELRRRDRDATSGTSSTAASSRAAPKDLHNTAVWIGGNNMSAGEQLLAMAQDAFFEPLRVSVMLDSNGSNTTAVAAVVKIEQTLGDLDGQKVVDPRRHRARWASARRACWPRDGAKRHHHVAQAGAGREGAPVHQRALRRAGRGRRAWTTRRSCRRCSTAPTCCSTPVRPGVQMVPKRRVDARCKTLKVAVDLNAVPPLGIEGIEVDRRRRRAGRRHGVRRVRRGQLQDEDPQGVHRPAVHAERSGARRRDDRRGGAGDGRQTEAVSPRHAARRRASIPGTVSIDVCGLDDGRLFSTARWPTAEALADPAADSRRCSRRAPPDLVAGPSGYGLPLRPRRRHGRRISGSRSSPRTASAAASAGCGR